MEQILEYSLVEAFESVTSILLTDIKDKMCWWQVSDVGDRFQMLVTDSNIKTNHQLIEKRRQHDESVTNILTVTIIKSQTKRCH